MYRYACLNNIAEIGLERFQKGFEKTDTLQDAQGILVRSADMHNMDMSDKLLAIARAGAGVNNIPIEECADKGIVVFNTPGANANGVKELVIAAMLLASRDIVGGIEWVNANASSAEALATVEKVKKQFAGTEILGKKLGIIGLGAIGVLVANSAESLGMKVYGYDPYVSVDSAWHLSRKINHVVDINDIYADCDIITIHVPYMESTKNMIDSSAISKMKDGVILINMARGGLVDEKSLIDAIDEGKIRKYVTDFADTTVAGHEGCIVIPHLGASTAESEDNCAMMAVDEIQDYLLNGNIRNSVNFPNCNMGVCQTTSRIAIMHKNMTSMISKFTSVMGNSGVNIAEMTNKSKGDYAYTLFDLDSPVTDDVLDNMSQIDGVLRVRVIK
ncbi:MAG: phosphoglycerate dehydrogenase [Lachnospiraceae bacterium]|nr:phosphoglycerate dehydrogenase [Lachnospiraceae bacterium]